jgi:hypothetical protein
MLTEYGLPFLFWLDDKVWKFSQYLARWVIALDPGEDE